MEIEAKFALSDEETLHRLEKVEQLAGYTLSAAETKQVHDLYLDTPDREILAGGYALRQRDVAGTITMTLKGLGGVEGAIHRREELEVMLPPENPGETWLASPVYARLYALTGEAILHPLFTLRQTRIKRQINQNEQPVAEMSLDEVRLVAGRRRQSYYELELELLADGTETDLSALVGSLQSEWKLDPLSSSKFERALTFVDAKSAAKTTSAPKIEAAALRTDSTEQPEVTASPPKLPAKPGLTLDDSMAKAAYKTLWFHLQRMIYHEPGTRLEGKIEALHDMRVATRRMRAAMKVFENYLDMKQMRPFVKSLRKTARVLGVVRDLDVFWEKTQHYLDKLPEAERPDLEPLRAAWEKERREGREKMLAYFDSKRYQNFKEAFSAFLQNPDAGALPVFNAKGRPQPYRLRHTAPVALYQRLAVVSAYEEWLTGPDVSLERLHHLRVDCKKLRYTLEFFQETLSPDAKELINALKHIQDHLGDLQDAVVASNILHNFLTWGTWRGAREKDPSPPAEQIVAPGVSLYLAHRQAELQELADTFPQVWENTHSAQFSQLLAKAIKTL